MNRYIILIRGQAAASRRKHAAQRCWDCARIHGLRLVQKYAAEEYCRYSDEHDRCRSRLTDHYAANLHTYSQRKV